MTKKEIIKNIHAILEDKVSPDEQKHIDDLLEELWDEAFSAVGLLFT